MTNKPVKNSGRHLLDTIKGNEIDKGHKISELMADDPGAVFDLLKIEVDEICNEFHLNYSDEWKMRHIEKIIQEFGVRHLNRVLFALQQIRNGNHPDVKYGYDIVILQKAVGKTFPHIAH